MVLAFLKAEIDSYRFGPAYKIVLSMRGLSRSPLIENADLQNTCDNRTRIGLLQEVRGYGANQYLFAGFPNNVLWRRVTLRQTKLRILKYAYYPEWIKLSGGSRSVIDGARNIDAIQVREDINADVKAIVEKTKNGESFPELIAVQGNGSDLILIEGSKRATAYAIAKRPRIIHLIVGSSPDMANWRFY